jgi:hypothetical protein
MSPPVRPQVQIRCLNINTPQREHDRVGPFFCATGIKWKRTRTTSLDFLCELDRFESVRERRAHVRDN